ncbi:MAG: hypothetical protein MHM6MM_008471, partial [Cercozoa sp. M6MM]
PLVTSAATNVASDCSHTKASCDLAHQCAGNPGTWTEFTSLLGLLFERLDAEEAVKEFFRALGGIIDFMRR